MLCNTDRCGASSQKSSLIKSISVGNMQCNTVSMLLLGRTVWFVTSRVRYAQAISELHHEVVKPCFNLLIP